MCSLNIVFFFPRILKSLPIGATVHSHCVESFEGLLKRNAGEGGVAVNCEKTQFFLNTLYLSLRFKHYAKLQNQEQEIVVFFKELCHFMRICVLYTKEVADYSWLTVRILASFFVYKTHIPIMWLIPLSNKSVHGWLVG